MILGLSSSAAPDLSLRELVEVCRRRGLAALELVLGDAHGLSADSEDQILRDALRLTTMRDVTIAAITPSAESAAAREEALRLATRLRVPVLVSAATLEAEQIQHLAASARGTRLLLLLGTDPHAAAELATVVESLSSPATCLAWEIDPAGDDPAATSRMLEILKGRVGLVRLRGGGPESASQTGFGMGALMARLALARYTGPMILTPTTPRHRVVWSAWLGRRGGWGCGSKQADPSLVTLATATNRTGVV